MKLFFTGLLLLTTINVFSAENTPQKVPSNLHIYSTGGNAYVDLVPHGCSGYRYYLNADHPKYDAIFSMLLAASMAKREIVVRFDGCSSGGSPQGNIIGVYLKQ